MPLLGMISSDEDDVHQCGRCKQLFHHVDHYFAHKRAAACKKAQLSNTDTTCRILAIGKSSQDPAHSTAESDKLQQSNSGNNEVSETTDTSIQLEDCQQRISTTAITTTTTTTITAAAAAAAETTTTLLEKGSSAKKQGQSLSHGRKQHGKSAEDKGKERCSQCGYIASTKQGLNDHVRRKHTNKSFQCNVCSRTFSLQHHLQRHSDSLHKPIAQLPAAMVVANVKHLLQRYGRRMIDLTKDAIRKDLGTGSLTSTNDENDLSAADSSSRQLICFVCCAVLSSPAGLWSHLENHRSWVPAQSGPVPANLFNLGASASQKVQPPIVECEIALNELPENNEESYDRYETIDHEALSQLIQENVLPPGEQSKDDRSAIIGLTKVAAVCCLAGEQLSRIGRSSSPSIVQFTMADFDDLDKVIETDRTVRCPYCSWTADSLVDLYQHKVTDHVICAHFRCVQCPRVFGDAFTYAVHRRFHEQRAFICDVCNAHFYKMDSVFAHKSSAHRRAPKTGGSTVVQCKQCGEVCKGRASLLRHQTVHNAAPTRYSCDECSRVFGKREHLKRHLLSRHSNERPFVCAVVKCGRAFKQADKLKRHERLVHGPGVVEKARTRPCPVAGCSRQFTRSDRLKRHLETEHRIEARWLVRCFRCERGFTGVRSLRTHILKSHYGFSKKKNAVACSDNTTTTVKATEGAGAPTMTTIPATTLSSVPGNCSASHALSKSSSLAHRNEASLSSSTSSVTSFNSSPIVNSSPSPSMTVTGPAASPVSILIARSTDNSICHTKVITTSVTQNVVPPMNHLGEFKDQLTPQTVTSVPTSTSQMESTVNTILTEHGGALEWRAPW